MPNGDGLVSAGGSRGVQIGGTTETDTSRNDALLNNIFKMADSTVYRSISESRAREYISGKARVAQGESLETIRNSQGIFDSIFGTATIQGAHAQTVVQATDKHVLSMQENMEELKSITTDEFVERQTQYVIDELLTGDPTVDEFITLAAGESIQDAASIHTKKRALYIQEKNQIEFENTLIGSSERLSATLQDDSLAMDDKVKAIQSTINKLAPMPGQTEEAYRKSVATVITSELKNDRPELYQGIIQGKIALEGTDIETETMQFDAQTTQIMQEAYDAHLDRTDTQQKIDRSTAMAELSQAAANTTMTDTEFGQLVQSKLLEHGADLMTTTQLASLMTNRGKKIVEQQNNEQGVKDIASGTATTNTDRNKVADDMNLYEAALLQAASKKPEGQRDSALQDAHAAVLDKAIENNVVPTNWTAKWNVGLAHLVDNKGEANPRFLETLQHFNSKYEAKKELFAKDMDSLSLSNALGVKHLMRAYNISADEAARQYSTYQLKLDEARKFVDTEYFNKQLEDFVEDPDQRNWFTDILFGNWDEIDNQAQATNSMKQYITANVARTGDTGEGAWQGAVHDWMNTHEQVQGYAVNNLGTPLRERANLIDPNATFDDALGYYLNTQGAMKFGSGFQSDNVSLMVDDKFVTITPLADDGTFLPGLENSARRIPLQAVGNIYNEEVTNALIDVSISNVQSAADEAGLDLGSILGEEGGFGAMMRNIKDLVSGKETVAPTQDITETVKAEEGFRSEAYKDHLGNWTIGYGHTKGVKEGDTITREKAEATLQSDLQGASTEAQTLVKDFSGLPNEMQQVLTEMVFQMGLNRVQGFKKMLTELNKPTPDFDKVAAEMKDSRWYKQTTNRAKRKIQIVSNI